MKRIISLRNLGSALFALVFVNIAVVSLCLCLCGFVQSQGPSSEYYGNTGVNFHIPYTRYGHFGRRPSQPERRFHSWISGTFYNEVDYEGLPMSYFFSGKSCVNFPYHNRMASVKPYGCIMLFSKKFCEGPITMVSHNVANLYDLGMPDGVASIKNCFSDTSITRFPSHK